MKDTLLTQTDLIIFFGTLAAIMAAGLMAGWKEKTSSDYFLAGKGARWWGVAGSIFGSNVSANHMMGMMGTGFAVGFAVSHFEITAIAGLLILCYVLLPVYRKLNIYTLSEYLNRRYDDRARMAYAVVMLVIIVFVMTVPAFYIGSRSINFLLKEDTGQKAVAQLVYGEEGEEKIVTGIQLMNAGRGYLSEPTISYGEKKDAPDAFKGFKVELADGTVAAVVMKNVGSGYYGDTPTLTLKGSNEEAASLEPVVKEGAIVGVKILDGGSGYSAENAPVLEFSSPSTPTGRIAQGFVSIVDGGVRKLEFQAPAESLKADKKMKLFISGGGKEAKLSPGDIDKNKYILGILVMALVTGAYTVIGGLKAVIITDVIQSVLMLIAGIILAFLMFSHPEIGGWAELRSMDLASNGGKERFHLYNPTDHPGLPWSGVLTGLMVLHFYYWGANQFIVQRALAAKSDKEARIGIVSAGFFKLLIPFFSIGCGVAAWYYYANRAQVVPQDAVFLHLLADLVQPVGWGLVGLIAAGVFGAILSSIDSMLNSGATIITFDFYKRFVNPNASETQLVKLGKILVIFLLVLAASLAIITCDPNSEGNFFLEIATHQAKLIAGVVVAFFLGMLWKRATASGAIVAIIGGVAFSFLVPEAYTKFATPGLIEVFGPSLNSFHAVFISTVFSLILHIAVSLATQPDKQKSKLTWVGLGIFSKQEFRYFTIKLLGSLVFYAFLAILMIGGMLSSLGAAVVAAAWTWLMFLDNVIKMMLKAAGKGRAYSLLKEDRFWGGLLASCAIFMMYYFR